MEVVDSSKILVNIYQISWLHIPDDNIYQNLLSHPEEQCLLRNVRLGSTLRITTPNLWSKVLPEKLMVTQLVNKYQTFYGFRWISGTGHQVQIFSVLKT
jgi:hypothetical protein